MFVDDPVGVVVVVCLGLFVCLGVFVVCVGKGTWWMPWHWEPMKDVGGRDSPRGVVNRALIRGFPNGVTRP
jgi:hypothetical protein